MNNEIAMLVLLVVRAQVTAFCSLPGFVQDQPSKMANENIQQRTLPGFLAISILTMSLLSSKPHYNFFLIWIQDYLFFE